MVTLKWTVVKKFVSGLNEWNRGGASNPFQNKIIQIWTLARQVLLFCRRDVALSGMWVLINVIRSINLYGVSSPNLLVLVFCTDQQLVENRRSFRKDARSGCAGEIGRDGIGSAATICGKFPWILRSPHF
jgi:hypothetical protein